MMLNIGVPRTGTVYAQQTLSPIRPHGHYVTSMASWPDSTFKPIPDGWDSDDFTFAVVRNPFDLIVSWWALMHRPDVQAHHPDRKLATLPFRDAVTLMAHRVDGWPRRAPLFHQLFTDDWSLKVDYLARYETLDDDLHEIARLAGGTYTPAAPANRSHRTPWPEYYDEHLYGLVEDAWGADLQYFGYDRAGITGRPSTTFGPDPHPTSNPQEAR